MSDGHLKKGLTLRYAKGFECIGASCPDNCCHGWSVHVDRETYGRLQKVLPAEQLKQNIKKREKGGSGAYAEIVLKEDGNCPFIDTTDALCTIHKKHGPSCLSVTCRQYPRQISLIGESVELGLSLSCPEAARLCLLDESAVELVSFDPEPLLKEGALFFYTQAERPANYYLTYLNDIREIMLQLLAHNRLPFDSRLFIALYFAKQVSEYLYDGVETVDDSKIAEKLNLLLTQGYMDKLHEEFEALAAPSGFSLSLLQTVICARISKRGMLTQLIIPILKENGIEVEFVEGGAEFTAKGGVNQAFEKMASHYQERHLQLRQRYGQIVERYFENYSRNFWFKDLFVKSPSLAAHMRELVVRIAVVKFIFFLNPTLNPLFNSVNELSPEAAKKLLDEVAVTTFYQFSRGIEHSDAFIELVHAALATQQMDSFAHQVLLLKF